MQFLAMLIVVGMFGSGIQAAFDHNRGHVKATVKVAECVSDCDEDDDNSELIEAETEVETAAAVELCVIDGVGCFQ